MKFILEIIVYQIIASYIKQSFSMRNILIQPFTGMEFWYMQPSILMNC